MSIAGPIEIYIGLPEEYLQEAAELFYDSLQQKFYPIMNIREQGVSFLQKHLNPKGTMVALDGKQLLGNFKRLRILFTRLHNLCRSFFFMETMIM